MSGRHTEGAGRQQAQAHMQLANMCCNADCVAVASASLSWPVICPLCNVAVYCNTTCQDAAWEIGHRENCLCVRTKVRRLYSIRRESLKKVQLAYTQHQHDVVMDMSDNIMQLVDYILMRVETHVDDVEDMKVAGLLYGILASSHEHRGQFKESLVFYERSKKLHDRNFSNVDTEIVQQKVQVYTKLALCYRREGEFVKVEELFSKCVRMVKSFTNRFYMCTQLGFSNLQIGKFDEAQMWSKKAMKLIAMQPPQSDQPDLMSVKIAKMSCLAMCLDTCGQAEFFLYNHDSALLYYEQMLVLVSRLNMSSTIVSDTEEDFSSHLCKMKTTLRMGIIYWARAVTESTKARMRREEDARKIREFPEVLCSPPHNREQSHPQNRSKYADDIHDAKVHLRLVLQYTRHSTHTEVLNIEADANLWMSLLHFHENEVQDALHFLKTYLQITLDNADKHCQFCPQKNGNNDVENEHVQHRMLVCGNCRVVRFCSRKHQKMASKQLHVDVGKYYFKHNSVCFLLKTFKQMSQGDANAKELVHAQLKFLENHKNRPRKGFLY